MATAQLVQPIGQTTGFSLEMEVRHVLPGRFRFEKLRPE